VLIRLASYLLAYGRIYGGIFLHSAILIPSSHKRRKNEPSGSCTPGGWNRVMMSRHRDRKGMAAESRRQTRL